MCEKERARTRRHIYIYIRAKNIHQISEGLCVARAIIRALIKALANHVSQIEILKAEELIEREPDYARMIGYELLQVKLTRRKN